MFKSFSKCSLALLSAFLLSPTTGLCPSDEATLTSDRAGCARSDVKVASSGGQSPVGMNVKMEHAFNTAVIGLIGTGVSVTAAFASRKFTEVVANRLP